jgi:presequence protease
MLANVTLDQANYQKLAPRLADFLATIPAADMKTATWTPEKSTAWEGLTIPAQVNYVGKAARIYDLGYSLDGSALVIVQNLNTGWFWERVRVQGGAYGGNCVFDELSGVVAYVSYRDPNLLSTLEIYDKTAEFLRTATMSDDDLTRAIIGTIGRLDGYQLPDAKGFTSLLRYLTGTTDVLRQRIRDEVLSTSVADFRSFADALDRLTQQGLVCVLGSEQAISTANTALGGKLQVTKVL